MSDKKNDTASEEMVNPVISIEENNGRQEQNNGRSTKDSVSTNTNPPLDIITQTDKDGNPINRPPPNSDEIRRSSLPVTRDTSESPSLFRVLCCCLCIEEKPETRSTELSVRPSVSRQAIEHYPSRTSISGQTKLLPEYPLTLPKRKCLALDLDETLVHSSFQFVRGADFVIPVPIDHMVHNVYVLKRPGVDEFMRRMGQIYEIVIYTASLGKYANPLLDALDIHKVINARLFRESCVYSEGHYVKDLSLLNRDISQCIIVDNSPFSYKFHPDYAIDCGSFIDDPSDVEMWMIADFLESLNSVDDVRGKTRSWRQWCSKNESTSTVPKK